MIFIIMLAAHIKQCKTARKNA